MKKKKIEIRRRINEIIWHSLVLNAKKKGITIEEAFEMAVDQWNKESEKGD